MRNGALEVYFDIKVRDIVAELAIVYLHEDSNFLHKEYIHGLY